MHKRAQQTNTTDRYVDFTGSWGHGLDDGYHTVVIPFHQSQPRESWYAWISLNASSQRTGKRELSSRHVKIKHGTKQRPTSNNVHIRSPRVVPAIYAFLERLLRDLGRLGAAFLLPRLRDLPRRFTDFLLGAAFLRDARRLFGAMAVMILCIFCMGVGRCASQSIGPLGFSNKHLGATAPFCMCYKTRNPS